MTTADATDVDTTFDRYARMVRRTLRTPVALVSLVEPDRQVFPGAVGLPEPWQTERETPLSHSFCQYVVADQKPLIVTDARTDPRLRDNLAIEDLGVIAYAGFPITDHAGATVGSLCAIDSTPREWTGEEVEILQDLALACSAEWVHRAQARETAAALELAEELGQRSRVLLALSAGLSFTETLADVANAIAEVASDTLGCLRAGVWLRDHDVSTTGARRHQGETLQFVEDTASTWRSAQNFARLPLDETNPLGVVLTDLVARYFSSRAEQNGLYPHLITPDQIGEARAFVPLVAGGHTYGALALVWSEERGFDDEDRITIAALATFACLAIHRAQLFQDRVEVSTTLQHAMLTELPQPDHLVLAARYLPARISEQVGGDWYDAVVMPGGATHLMIGDVEGHDIKAAAIMGQLRSMLRMTAWMSDHGPAHDLGRLDQAMSDLAVPKLTSAVLARIEQTPQDAAAGLRRLRWSNAGHLPPLLVTADGTARFLGHDPATRDDRTDGTGVTDGIADGPDPLLGLNPRAPRHDHVVTIEPESTVLLYTDGLTERRREVLDISLERLRTAASRAAHLPPGEFLDAVLDAMGTHEPDDDIALLAVRFGTDPEAGQVGSER